jgi:phospholipid/cholesterol/gamma-HCH transport system substrate-binding protein
MGEVADFTGTGRWFDVYLQNLIPLPASVKLPGTSGGKNRSAVTPSPSNPPNGNPLPIIK